MSLSFSYTSGTGLIGSNPHKFILCCAFIKHALAVIYRYNGDCIEDKSCSQRPSYNATTSRENTKKKYDQNCTQNPTRMCK